MDKQNHTTKRVGSVEVTTIDEGKFTRRRVFLGSTTSGEGMNRTTKRCLVDKPTDWTVDEFVNMTALARLFPRWTAGNHFNNDTVFHPETLKLIELNQFEVVLGIADASDIVAAAR
jgi:hypothetical protein